MIMLEIIAAFLSGFLFFTFIAWQIHRRQARAWQSEYRRLMVGIKAAESELRNTLRGHGYNMLTEGLIKNAIQKLGSL